jgi:hypothetical protein
MKRMGRSSSSASRTTWPLQTPLSVQALTASSPREYRPRRLSTASGQPHVVSGHFRPTIKTRRDGPRARLAWPRNASDRTGKRTVGPPSNRDDQPRARRASLHQREHDQDPTTRPLLEARCPEPGPGCRSVAHRNSRRTPPVELPRRQRADLIRSRRRFLSEALSLCPFWLGPRKVASVHRFDRALSSCGYRPRLIHAQWRLARPRLPRMHFLVDREHG